VLSARVDGAEEDVTTTLFAGGADDFTVTDEGHTLFDSEYESEEAAMAADAESVAAGRGAVTRQLGANTGFSKLITSLVEAGFPETNLPEDRNNFESVIGTRVRFEQRTDVESTKKLGKRTDKKTGKEYDRQDLVIDQVYSLPGTTVAAPKAAAKAAPAKAGKKAAAAAAPGVDVAALATETLTTILAEAGGSISKAKAGMKVIAKLMKHAQREEVRKFLFDDANLSAIDGVDYDAATTTISIAA
jgi:hypothetical protein